MRKNKRFATLATGVLGVSSILAGCGGATSTGNSPAGTGTGKTVITVQLQPNTGASSSTQNQTLIAATQKYEKLHPNVQVKFLPNSYTDISVSNAALLTEASAHSAPDVVWEQYGPANSGSIPNGILLNLSPYLNQPNPYIAGNKKWIDVWEPQYIPYMTKSPGQMYILLASSIATGIAYNKADFAKAGITSTPTTFAQWVADMGKLKAAGIDPLMFTAAGQCNTSWFERKINSSFLAPSVASFNVNNSQVATGLDFAVGVEKGIISMNNPTYAAGWKLLGQLKPYMAPGASQYDVCAPTNAVSPPLSPLTPFVQNKFAMVWIHTGMVPILNNLGFKGKYGVFSFPTITKASSPYASGVSVTGVVGGPNGSGEWSVTTQAADASMTPAKTKQVMDYLEYLYTPNHIGPLVQAMGNGAYIPLLLGASSGAASDTTQLLPQGKIPVTVDSIINVALTTQAHNEGQRILQNYLNNTLTFAQFSTQWNSMLTQAAQQWAQANNVNLSKYK